MPLNHDQKMKLGNLLAAHRGAPGVADYLDSPPMQAVFSYVDGILARAKKISPVTSPHGRRRPPIGVRPTSW